MGYLDSLFGLEGKTVLITGVNGQLGSVLRKAFTNSGCRVFGFDVGNHAEKTGNDVFKCDIRDKSQVKEAFDAITARVGVIDILVNNAGVSVFEPFENRPESSIDWVMDVNLKGTFFCIQEYVCQYDNAGGNSGSIINIGSIFGTVSPDFRNYRDGDRRNSEIYGATKAGIIQFTRYFAVHLAERGIRVNCVSPGGIYNASTPQQSEFIQNYSFRCPMKRMAEAEEIVGGVLYFSSSCAQYTTGQNLVIDGGLTAW